MKLILHFELILISFTAYSQQIMIENSQSRIIYAGAENPLQIHVHGYKPSELTVKVSHGEIIQKDMKGAYIWKICEPNNQFRSIMKIYKEAKLIDSVVFRLKHLPEPNILLPNSGPRPHGGPVPFRGIRAEIENFTIEGIPCEIISYDFGVLKTTDSIYRIINNKGAYLDKDSRELFGNASTGDKYLIKNIIVRVGCLQYQIKVEKEYQRILY